MTYANGHGMDSKGPVRVWLGRLVKLLAGLFVAFHAYALLLKFVPVPGTILMAQRAIGGEGDMQWPTLFAILKQVIYTSTI